MSDEQELFSYHSSLITYHPSLLVRELHDALRDALAVIGGDVHDDGVAGLEGVDDALEVGDGADRLTVDALYDHVLLHPRVECYPGLINVLDEEAAHALQVALVC